MNIAEKFKNQTMSRVQMRYVVGGRIQCCINGGCSDWCGAGSHCRLVSSSNACCESSGGTLGSCANRGAGSGTGTL